MLDRPLAQPTPQPGVGQDRGASLGEGLRSVRPEQRLARGPAGLLGDQAGHDGGESGAGRLVHLHRQAGGEAGGRNQRPGRSVERAEVLDPPEQPHPRTGERLHLRRVAAPGHGEAPALAQPDVEPRRDLAHEPDQGVHVGRARLVERADEQQAGAGVEPGFGRPGLDGVAEDAHLARPGRPVDRGLAFAHRQHHVGPGGEAQLAFDLLPVAALVGRLAQDAAPQRLAVREDGLGVVDQAGTLAELGDHRQRPTIGLHIVRARDQHRVVVADALAQERRQADHAVAVGDLDLRKRGCGGEVRLGELQWVVGDEPAGGGERL